LERGPEQGERDLEGNQPVVHRDVEWPILAEALDEMPRRLCIAEVGTLSKW
jgi:hypothetical protein